MIIAGKIKDLNYRRIGYHVLFWVTLNFSYDFLYCNITGSKFSTSLLYDFISHTPVQAFIVYFTLYFLFPKFLHRKKYVKFFCCFLVFIISSILLSSLLIYYFKYGKDIGLRNIIPDYQLFIKRFFIHAINLNLMIVGIAAAIKLSKKWIETQKRQLILEKEKIEISLQLKEAELKLIRSQINPGFLFNALKGLHKLSIEKSAKASEMVLKISSLLDYMLYNSAYKFVDLNTEINNIENYIYLQQINFGNSTKITFHIPQNTNSIKVKPAIILPIVENIFKFLNENCLHKIKIDIDLLIKEYKIIFVIETVCNSKINKEELESSFEIFKKDLNKHYKDLFKLEHEQKNEVLKIFLEITTD